MKDLTKEQKEALMKADLDPATKIYCQTWIYTDCDNDEFIFSPIYKEEWEFIEYKIRQAIK